MKRWRRREGGREGGIVAKKDKVCICVVSVCVFMCS